jgi:RNA polymerase sigma-70 factor (ECF subfamily)
MKIQCDDPDTFKTVYERVFPTVLRVSYGITMDVDIAEDICQEAFIKFYHHAAPFPSIDQATYWLLRVVKNLSFNYFKRKKRERKAVENFFHQPKHHQETGEDALLKSETERLVQQAIARLPDTLKSVIVLKEYANLSYKDIAKVLHITENNVKVRVHRARTQLEKLIEKENVHVR